MRFSTSSRAHSPWAQLSASARIALTSSADIRFRAVGTLKEEAVGANAWIDEAQSAAAMARLRRSMIGMFIFFFFFTMKGCLTPRNLLLSKDLAV